MTYPSPVVEERVPSSPVTTTLIGRGHSGTRAFCKLLVDSGVFMGPKLSPSYCYSPINAYGRYTGTRIALRLTAFEGAMYEAARLFGRQVRQTGALTWDFSEAMTATIPQRFTELVDQYLAPIDRATGPRGWKLPETVLMLPWLTQLRPDIRYVHWVRDPRDGVLHRHLTDDLGRFDVPFDDRALGVKALVSRDARLLRRAISWKYQHDLVQQAQKPRHWLVVRFEDFVLDHEREIRRIADFLDVRLKPIAVNKSVVGRWKEAPTLPELPFLRPLMETYGYV